MLKISKLRKINKLYKAFSVRIKIPLALVYYINKRIKKKKHSNDGWRTVQQNDKE